MTIDKQQVRTATQWATVEVAIRGEQHRDQIDWLTWDAAETEALLAGWARSSVEPTGEADAALPMLGALLDVDAWLVLSGQLWRVEGVGVERLWEVVTRVVMQTWGAWGVRVDGEDLLGCTLSPTSVLRRHDRRWSQA